MLWVEGHAQVQRHAERMNFVPGARWSERYIGTNAPGTALAVDHAVQIFTAEHYCRPVQAWTCAAAPVHDPRTHRLIGAVDITGGDHLASPQSLALVQATARAAEAYLAELAAAPAESARRRTRTQRPRLRRSPARRRRRHPSAAGPPPQRDHGAAGRTPRGSHRRTARPRALRRAHRHRRHPARRTLPAARPVGAAARLTPVPPAAAAAHGPRRRRRRPVRGRPAPRRWPPTAARCCRSPKPRASSGCAGCWTTGCAGPAEFRAIPRLLEEWVRTPWGEDDLEIWEALLSSRHASETRRVSLASARTANCAAPTGSKKPILSPARCGQGSRPATQRTGARTQRIRNVPASSLSRRSSPPTHGRSRRTNGEASRDEPLRRARVRRGRDELPVTLRPLDRGRVRRPERGRLLREPHTRDGSPLHRDRPRHGGRRGASP